MAVVVIVQCGCGGDFTVYSVAEVVIVQCTVWLWW